MNEQQELRNALINYLEKSGCKQCHICKMTGIKTDILSRWKNNIIPELWQEDLLKIEEYLNNHN